MCGTSWGNYVLAPWMRLGAHDCMGCGEAILSYDACLTAATSGAALGIGPLGASKNWDGPPGCHIRQGSNFQFNSNMEGTSAEGHTPICLISSSSPSPPSPSPLSTSVVISFDFETDAIGTCPHGWTCTGSAAVQSVASLPDGCPIASGTTGSHVLSIGCDDDTGTATSSIFTLPAGIASLKFKRSGGADAPSGFYVKLEENNAVVAQSNDGTDTDNMFEVTLSLSDYAEQAVYIEVSDQQQSSWGKVAIDDIRFYNDQGESLDLITTTPLKPPSPSPYTFTGTASLKTAVQAFNDDSLAATKEYGPIADWDVSAVTDMSGLFGEDGRGLANFNADISSWDTSGVTTMRYMFVVRPARALTPQPSVGTRPALACAIAAPRP